jgi:hypothetical protein
MMMTAMTSDGLLYTKDWGQKMDEWTGRTHRTSSTVDEG